MKEMEKTSYTIVEYRTLVAASETINNYYIQHTYVVYLVYNGLVKSIELMNTWW
jgi:hypothetical protein